MKVKDETKIFVNTKDKLASAQKGYVHTYRSFVSQRKQAWDSIINEVHRLHDDLARDISYTETQIYDIKEPEDHADSFKASISRISSEFGVSIDEFIEGWNLSTVSDEKLLVDLSKEFTNSIEIMDQFLNRRMFALPLYVEDSVDEFKDNLLDFRDRSIGMWGRRICQIEEFEELIDEVLLEMDKKRKFETMMNALVAASKRVQNDLRTSIAKATNIRAFTASFDDNEKKLIREILGM